MRSVHLLATPLTLLGLLSFTTTTQARPVFTPQNVGVKTSPTQDDIAKAVLKALGALALHEASKPQPDDGIVETIARGVARQGRDDLIDSALQDLSPRSKAVERAAVRGLVVLSLDGKLDRNRDRVLAQLRRTNPDMADAVEVAEFLIQLSQAIDRARR